MQTAAKTLSQGGRPLVDLEDIDQYDRWQTQYIFLMPLCPIFSTQPHLTDHTVSPTGMIPSLGVCLSATERGKTLHGFCRELLHKTKCRLHIPHEPLTANHSVIGAGNETVSSSPSRCNLARLPDTARVRMLLEEKGRIYVFIIAIERGKIQVYQGVEWC